jgi:hypothetical protein
MRATGYFKGRLKRDPSDRPPFKGSDFKSQPSHQPVHTDSMAISRNEDRLAIDVYRHAEETGQPITLGLVERRLDELRGHPQGCECGLCTAAASVGAGGVWWVVRGWAGGIAGTRRRSAR